MAYASRVVAAATTTEKAATLDGAACAEIAVGLPVRQGPPSGRRRRDCSIRGHPITRSIPQRMPHILHVAGHRRACLPHSISLGAPGPTSRNQKPLVLGHSGWHSNRPFLDHPDQLQPNHVLELRLPANASPESRWSVGRPQCAQKR